MTRTQTSPPPTYQIGEHVSTPDGPGVICALTPDFEWIPLQAGGGPGRRCYLWEGHALDGPFVVLLTQEPSDPIRGYTYDQLRARGKEESSP